MKKWKKVINPNIENFIEFEEKEESKHLDILL